MKATKTKGTLKKLVIILAMTFVFIINGCSNSGQSTVVSTTETSGKEESSEFVNTIPMYVPLNEYKDADKTYYDVSLEEQVNNCEIIGEANRETIAILEKCQKKIINYFASYNLDVAPQISKLEKVFVFKEEKNPDNSPLYGYYNSGTSDDVYLNQDILEDKNSLRFNYVHELMHYLGCTDSETTMISEGMADAITENILGDNSEESYDKPRWLCHQLLICDPDIISSIINGEDLDDRIDNRLKNVPRKWYVEEHNLKMSEVLDILLYQIEYYDDLNIGAEDFESYVNQCEDIILAYCYTFDLTEDQIQEIDRCRENIYLNNY